jgi:phosphoribosylformylglycinamidine (FGAM) synthase-like enzyme
MTEREPFASVGDGHAVDRHTLGTAAIASREANRSDGHVEKTGEKRAQLIVREIVDGRSGQSNEHGIPTRAGELGFARARNHTNVDLDARVSGANQG